jgi:hypothetical protein
MKKKYTKWILKLECGHTVERPIKHRVARPMSWDNHRVQDPAPKWVYCEKCALHFTTETEE